MTVKELQIEERLSELLLPVRLTVNGFNLPFEKVEEFKKDLIAFVLKEIRDAKAEAIKEYTSAKE